MSFHEEGRFMICGHREAIILITVEECTPLLQKFLKESRRRHSFAVSEQAASLALLYGADVEKARIAGLLHDLAKNLSEKQRLQWTKELHVSFDSITLRSPSLWHAVLSEAYVREKLGICDPEVLWAIRYHTTGTVSYTHLNVIGRGQGHSKKEAEQMAAKEALELMGE